MAVHSQPLRLLVPHIFVWPPLLLPSSSSARVCPTQSFTQQLCHAESFTQQLCHTQSFTQQRCHTHTIFQDNLSHTTLSRTIFTQQLCHTHKIFHTTTLQHTHYLSKQSFTHTHNFVTHHLSNHFVLRGGRATYMTLGWLWWPAWPFVARRAAALCVAGVAGVAGVALAHIHLRFSVADVALGDINLRFARVGSGGALGPRYSPAAPRHFAWQARHLVTSTFVLRGRTALGWLWWRAWAPLFARGAAALCVAGAALGDIDLRFAWQLWHLLTSTFVLRGRRGPYDIGLALVARFGAVSCPRRRGTLRGRRGTWRHRPSLCVAVV